MTGPSVAVVCTTIGDGSFLKHYAKALESAGRDAAMYVIPDHKTPLALFDAVQEYANTGLLIKCPSPVDQSIWLDKLGAPAGFFPWNTDHRRNVGYLMAYESGADIIISVDDDNLPQDGWLGEHARAFDRDRNSIPTTQILINGGFLDPCHLLDVGEIPAPARGMPRREHTGPRAPYWPPSYPELAINEGLWLGEPDVDAISRIALHPVSTALKDSMILAPGTWAPVNSQNTAIRREVLPAYYFFRSPRFGDIYQGYLAQACAKHLGHSVRFGTPVVRHERNDHDLLADLEAELPDIRALDPWLDWLTDTRPSGSTYAEAYESLSEHMLGVGLHDATQPEPVRDRMIAMAAQMRQWLALCGRLG